MHWVHVLVGMVMVVGMVDGVNGVNVVNGENGNCRVDPFFPNFDPFVYMFQTSDSVGSVHINSVTPPIQTPPKVATYLSSSSCLGYAGPLGSYGPLGSLGPIGSNTWSTSYWITGTGMNWSTYAHAIAGLHGPLSAHGPLSSLGALSRTAYFNWLPCINDFAANLAAGGLWTVLGPLGPLGPAGALGPLGPIGATSFAIDSNGQFVDHRRQVVRTVSAPWDGISNKTWELYEFYTQAFASQFAANDCSFVVEGIVGSHGEAGDVYAFTSSIEQYVTILLVPLKRLDNWILTIRNQKHTIATIGPDLFVNWIQLRVPANTRLTAEVQLGTSWHPFARDYRLYVSASYDIDGTNIKGPHLKSYIPL